ncbi:ATP synthase subunit C [Neptunomonas antarctica]|jgi:V/A-type H+-transporting ATPase subunit K|uniref:V/A-type H+-transporting ATPase subunit K n=1 Tax=Neptunomonas antarctica TaxID=619304 RepID=A0A1N7J6E5_9GAMM|nr:ATP synthase subunit C [Neptunomonas antarctica]SIS44882.1 V/A-type H+-transporting ATPase subunit K [Neptunomonas antarctica]
MEQLIITLGWLGIFAPTALGAIGSSYGCSRAGQAAAGALLDTESGYGKYIGLSAMPSTQVILGIVVMFTLNRELTLENSPGIFAIGVLTGLALMMSAIYQGQALVAAINAAKNKPEIFGLAIAPAAIVEGFSVFAFVFALVLAGSLPA